LENQFSHNIFIAKVKVEVSTLNEDSNVNDSVQSSMNVEDAQPILNTFKGGRRKLEKLVPIGFPLTQSEIVDLPIEELKELMAKKNLSKSNVDNATAWRRQWKNKVNFFNI
jgi:hypothetical protein